jgi:hypothetical protein
MALVRDIGPRFLAAYQLGPQRVVQNTKRRLGLGRNGALPLPLEIYGRIIHFVESRHDLLSLCLVSKAFHLESIIILYRTVELRGDAQAMFSWFSFVAANSQRASWVHSLRLVSGVKWSQLKPGPDEWYSHVGSCLGKLANLKKCVVN